MWRLSLSPLLLLLCWALAVAGYRECLAGSSQTMTTGDPSFHLPHLPPGRTLDTVVAINLDGRDGNEYVVISHTDESPFGRNRTRIQVFAYDTRMHAFRIVVSGSAFRVDSLELRDLTGDGIPEVVALLDEGGNDEVATMGMAVYSGHGGRFRTIFKSLRGNPQPTILGSGRPAILYYQKHWPRFVAHVFAEPYVSDIFAVRNGAFVSVKREHPEVFLADAEDYLDQYRSTRDSTAVTADSTSSTDGLQLLIPAKLVMTSFRLAGARASLRTFWDSERAFLRRRLRKEFFDYLVDVYEGTDSYVRADVRPEIPNPGSTRRNLSR